MENQQNQQTARLPTRETFGMSYSMGILLLPSFIANYCILWATSSILETMGEVYKSELSRRREKGLAEGVEK